MEIKQTRRAKIKRPIRYDLPKLRPTRKSVVVHTLPADTQTHK